MPAMKRSLTGSVLRAMLLAWFVVVPGCFCLPAEVQSGQRASATNGQGGGTAKDFEFEVVSIRPVNPDKANRYGGGPTPTGCRLVMGVSDLIKLAYSPGWVLNFGRADRTQVTNAPNSGVYQIDARVAESDIAAWQAQGKDEELLRSALRAILRERFHLMLHEQVTEIPIYNLVVSSKGIRLKPSAPGAVLPVGYKFPDGGVTTLFERDPSQPARFYNATIGDLVSVLEGDFYHTDRPIQDGTGLSGRYDYSLYHVQGPSEDVDPSDYYLVKTLGLELKPGKGAGLNLVIDHIKKPSVN